MNTALTRFFEPPALKQADLFAQNAKGGLLGAVDLAADGVEFVAPSLRSRPQLGVERTRRQRELRDLIEKV